MSRSSASGRRPTTSAASRTRRRRSSWPARRSSPPATTPASTSRSSTASPTTPRRALVTRRRWTPPRSGDARDPRGHVHRHAHVGRRWIGAARSASRRGARRRRRDVVVTVMALQQLKQRLGTGSARWLPIRRDSFLQPSGLVGPGHLMSVLARRHMHLYGTPREAFAEVAISTRRTRRTAEARKRDAVHARGLLRGAADRRAALPVRLLPGDRRRGRGDHHDHGSRTRPESAAGPVVVAARTAAGRMGPGVRRVLHARRRLRVVGSSHRSRSVCTRRRASDRTTSTSP